MLLLVIMMLLHFVGHFKHEHWINEAETACVTVTCAMYIREKDLSCFFLSVQLSSIYRESLFIWDSFVRNRIIFDLLKIYRRKFDGKFDGCGYLKVFWQISTEIKQKREQCFRFAFELKSINTFWPCKVLN